MDLVLQRFAETDDGVIGRMGPWYTLEEEAKGNQTSISDIPAGEYTCRRRIYNKGGYETFEVTDVPGRSAILIHRGNTEEHTEGCILLGMKVGTLPVAKPEDGEPARHKIAVLSSGVAHRAFMALQEGTDEFRLTVKDPA